MRKKYFGMKAVLPNLFAKSHGKNAYDGVGGL